MVTYASQLKLCSRAAVEHSRKCFHLSRLEIKQQPSHDADQLLSAYAAARVAPSQSVLKGHSATAPSPRVWGKDGAGLRAPHLPVSSAPVKTKRNAWDAHGMRISHFLPKNQWKKRMLEVFPKFKRCHKGWVLGSCPTSGWASMDVTLRWNNTIAAKGSKGERRRGNLWSEPVVLSSPK